MLSTPVVVIDFETTGVSPANGDRITEVAALRLDGARVVDSYVTLVNAGVRIPAFVTALTGISDAMIADAPPASVVVRALVDFIGADTVVAHNASFDRGFLLAEAARQGICGKPFPTLCTMRLSRRLLPGLASYRLAAVAERLGVRYSGRAHRAEADARVAADVLLKLVASIAQRQSTPLLDPGLLRQLTDWPIRDAARRLNAAIDRPAQHLRADSPVVEGR
jgi:DNA polymerase-3 subunit epsilon